MDTTTQTKSDAQDKTAYQTPELIDYGSVDVVTQAVSGANTDQLGGSGPT